MPGVEATAPSPEAKAWLSASHAASVAVEQNLTNIQTTAELAQKLGLRLVTFHAGFLPHDPADPDLQRC